MTETPAKGKKGFLLYNPFSKNYFFRIYDPVDKSKFTDYRLAAEDIEVEIVADGLSLYASDGDERSLLDWSSEALGRPHGILKRK